MFKEKQTEVKSIAECVKVDPISNELWSWAENTEKWGKFLFYALIIYGFISSIVTSIIMDEFGDFESWNFVMFITNILQYALYAYIEYIVYRTIALLIASLATITQNTRVTAKLTEYKIRKAENNFSSTSPNIPKSAPSKGFNLSKVAQEIDNSVNNGWKCSKCGYMNPSGVVMCKSCGQYK